MARGIFTLKQQSQGLQQKAWNNPVGTYAGSFNGSSQYLTTPISANGALDISNNTTYTIEAWVYWTASAGNKDIWTWGGKQTGGPSSYYQLYWETSGNVIKWEQASTSTLLTTVTTTLTPTLNTWYHIAVVRNGSAITVYANGQSVGTGTYAPNDQQFVELCLGSLYYNTGYLQFFSGYISNFRFIKGTALYTSNFAPPAGPLAAITNTSLLTLQNATIIDNSTNAATITNGGSVTTLAAMPFTQLKTPAVDYLVVAGGGGGDTGGGGAGGLLQGSARVTTGSAITVTVGGGGAGGSSSAVDGQNSVFGSITALGGGRGSMGVNGYQADVSGGAYSGGSGGGAYQTSMPGNGTFGQGNKGGNASNAATSTAGGGGGAGTIGLNTMANYVGANGGTGIASAISGTVTNYAGGGAGGGYQSVGLGGAGGGGNAGVAGTTNTGGGGGGYHQDPTPNLPGGAGGSGIVIISYPDTYAAAAATTGSPTVSTSGSGSWYYPNSIAKVTYSSSYNSAWSFGTGDFTVEGYCYLTSGSSSTIPMFDARSGATASAWVLNVGTSTNQTYFYNGSLFYSSINIAYNTWNHIAVTRQSGTLKIWINGAQGYTGTVTANLDATGPLNIGDVIQTGQNWLGYLSNMRIVKGTSLYNSAFTPSTIPLTAVSGTTFLNGAVSGSPYLDSSTTNAPPNSGTTLPAWNQSSPFATGLGYKNRVYTYTASGTITF